MNLSKLALAAILSACATALARADSLSLNGEWGFALDPLARGEASGWPQLTVAESGVPAGFDVVTVPHCWSDDPRYEHTGLAWYARAFDVPASWKGRYFRLRFLRIADRCRVWLNGSFVGVHDGGSTPFSFDATPYLKPGEPNLLMVQVDNGWNDHTLPGSRPGQKTTDQVYPWWNYGGILDNVVLETEPAAIVEKIKIEPAFSKDGNVALTIRAWLHNRGAAGHFALSQTTIPAAGPTGESFAASASYDLAAGEAREVRLMAQLSRDHVHRWNLDDPFLYRATVVLHGPDGDYSSTRRFGLREITIRDAMFLVNGQPVHLAGANRARGHLVYGGLEPREMIAADLRLLKEAHLEFARLQHYAPTPELLDWADENGMLIIAEAGNWQLQPAQLASPEIRASFRELTGNMIEEAWNHPSVVAWSTGNEYPSWTPAGVDWTRDMVAWIKSIDSTRPVTFCALGEALFKTELPREFRSFHYVDFISINWYGAADALGKRLDEMHALWPEKPITISEYGRRADKVASEDVRVEQLREMLAQVRQRPFVCGLSYWSFNDYRSRYPDTGASGYREWGIVDAARKPRGLYRAMQIELSPAILTVARKSAGVVNVKVTARSDFPSATLHGYTIRSTGGREPWSAPLPELAPGATWEKEVRVPPNSTGFEVVRPTGFVAVAHGLD